MPVRTDRRTFLGYTATAGLALPTVMPKLVRAGSPNERVHLAGVGVGGKGWSDINRTSRENAAVVAVCDVDTRGRGKKAFEKYAKATKYTDWRKLLDKEHKELDGVTVSTPDHMHAPVTMSALQLGLATYTQKPMTRTIHEARQLRLEAERQNAVTQMGNQGHNGTAYLLLVQLIRDGAIGKIKEAHTWSNRPIWPQGIERPSGSDPVPDGFNWDLWLGVAPERPFKKGVYHPFKWRGWYAFGSGALGDMGCHFIDPVVWSLELGPASSVRYDGPTPMPETFPESEVLTYEFPGTRYTAGDTLTMKWHDGGKMPPKELAQLPEDRDLPKNGSLFIGEKGVIVCPHGGGPRLYPKEKFEGYQYPKLKGRDHYLQWTNAIRGEGRTTSNFSYAGPLTETVLMGVVASRVPGKKLLWDPENLVFTNSKKATGYVKPEYRDGWHVEGLA